MFRAKSVDIRNIESPALQQAERKNDHWFFKYKIYHIPFWYLYHYIWTAVNSGKPIEVLSFIFASPKFIFYVVFQAMAVYFNLYFLIPRYLEKGKYWQYISLLLITIFTAASCIVSGYFLSAYMQNSTTLELYGHGNFYHYFQVYTLPSTLTSMMLAMSIKLAKNWIQSRRKQQELEKEKLGTELKFLKSQMNPHFLFNTINSIFVLIHKNPMMASESLAKFSDLLRYQLYECNEQQIPLNQELVYVENFIELQALRQDHDLVELKVHIDPYAQRNFTIAPFVLIPFIENAFKHVSRKSHHPNLIHIDLRFEDDQLKLFIINSISSTFHPSTDAVKHSGFVLKNVQRRLDLIYPGNYSLKINQTSTQFEVNLQLTLQEEIVQEQIPA